MAIGHTSAVAFGISGWYHSLVARAEESLRGTGVSLARNEAQTPITLQATAAVG